MAALTFIEGKRSQYFFTFAFGGLPNGYHVVGALAGELHCLECIRLGRCNMIEDVVRQIPHRISPLESITADR
jgi:hypothetical protein